jgi:hypothetical protein
LARECDLTGFDENEAKLTEEKGSYIIDNREDAYEKVLDEPLHLNCSLELVDTSCLAPEPWKYSSPPAYSVVRGTCSLTCALLV